jgi:hypothetical protein
LLVWASYAAVVFLWAAYGGSFSPTDRLCGPLLYSGMGISLATGLGVGVAVMELVRRNSSKKRSGILIVLLASAVSAIAPILILAGAPYSRPSDHIAAGLNAVVVSFVALLFGVVNFVAFSLGILCSRTRVEASGERDDRATRDRRGHS